jgi:hypothetical protein
MSKYEMTDPSGIAKLRRALSCSTKTAPWILLSASASNLTFKKHNKFFLENDQQRSRNTLLPAKLELA